MTLTSDVAKREFLTARKAHHLPSAYYANFVRISTLLEGSGLQSSEILMSQLNDTVHSATKEDILNLRRNQIQEITKLFAEVKDRHIKLQLKPLIKNLKAAHTAESYCESRVFYHDFQRKIHSADLEFHGDEGFFLNACDKKALIRTEENIVAYKLYKPNQKFKTDDVVIQATQNEYLQLQELGIMKGIDAALTAKVIGTIGTYRFDVLKKAMQFGVYTNHTLAKERICQSAFDRLRALQILESGYGHDFAVLPELIDDYLGKIDSLLSVLEEEKGELINKIERSLKTEKKSLRWELRVLIESEKQIRKDKKAVLKHFGIRNKRDSILNALQTHHFAYNQAHRLQSNESKIRNGADKTKSLLANFLRERCAQIVLDAKSNNELITIGEAKTWGRGRLNTALADAKYLIGKYNYDHDRKLKKDHQGYFDPDNTGKLVSINSSRLGSGRRSTRNTLFAYCLVKEKSSDQKTSLNDVIEDSILKEVHSRGWRANRWREKSLNKERKENLRQDRSLHYRERVMESYYTLRELVSTANEGYLSAIARIFRSAFKMAWHTVKHAAISLAREFKRNWINFKNDYRKSPKQFQSNSDEVNFYRYIHSILSNQKDLSFIENMTLTEDQNTFIEFIETNTPDENEIKKLDARLKTIIQDMKNNKNDVTSDSEEIAHAPFFETSTPFYAWDPHTIFSGFENFLDEFSGFFERHYEQSPTTWIFATAVYFMTGLAASSPHITKEIMQTLWKLPHKVTEGFIEYNHKTGTAIGNGESGEFIAAGFTNMKIAFTLLDGITNGGDSFCAKAMAEMRDHLPLALIVILGSYALGAGISSANIPYLSAEISEEAGTVPQIEQTFAGLKLAGFTYESLHSRKNEPTVVSNMLTTLVRFIFNIIRLVNVPLAFGKALFWDGIYQRDWKGMKTLMKSALHPVRDLTKTVSLILLSVVDFGIRVGRLAYLIAKIPIKALGEALINFAANISPIKRLSRGILKMKRFIDMGYDALFRPLNNIRRFIRTCYAKLRTRSWFDDAEIFHSENTQMNLIQAAYNLHQANKQDESFAISYTNAGSTAVLGAFGARNDSFDDEQRATEVISASSDSDDGAGVAMESYGSGS